MAHLWRTAKWLVPGVAALALTACGQQGQSPSAAAQPVEKTFTVTAGNPQLQVDFLVGQLQQLTITERLDPKTGQVVDPPELRGTLKLTNTSHDQAARLVAGKLIFLDAQGQVIPLAKERAAAALTFNTYDTQRLDPGQETSQAVDVSFPRAGLHADRVQTVRLDLTYLPTPVRERSADTPVALKG